MRLNLHKYLKIYFKTHFCKIKIAFLILDIQYIIAKQTIQPAD